MHWTIKVQLLYRSHQPNYDESWMNDLHDIMRRGQLICYSSFMLLFSFKTLNDILFSVNTILQNKTTSLKQVLNQSKTYSIKVLRWQVFFVMKAESNILEIRWKHWLKKDQIARGELKFQSRQQIRSVMRGGLNVK